MKGNCYYCGKRDVDVRIEEREGTRLFTPDYDEITDVTITCEQKHAYCTECGNEVYDLDIEGVNIFTMWDKVNELGLLPIKARKKEPNEADGKYRWYVYYKQDDRDDVWIMYCANEDEADKFIEELKMKEVKK